MVRKVINRVCYILIGLLISISSNAQNIPDSIYYDSTPKPLNEVNLKAELLKHNIPHADIVLAQAKLETGNFKSKLVRTHNNLFGLRKGKKYRKYSHWTQCIKDYKQLISNKYKGGSYYSFLIRINYATNPNYTKILKSIVLASKKIASLFLLIF